MSTLLPICTTGVPCHRTSYLGTFVFPTFLGWELFSTQVLSLWETPKDSLVYRLAYFDTGLASFVCLR